MFSLEYNSNLKFKDNYSVCIFYEDKSICSFDPIKIASDQSNTSENPHMVRTFDKNTSRINWKNIFESFYSCLLQPMEENIQREGKIISSAPYMLKP